MGVVFVVPLLALALLSASLKQSLVLSLHWFHCPLLDLCLSLRFLFQVLTLHLHFQFLEGYELCGVIVVDRRS